MALHGINLPLAWVGAEKILVDVFRELGLTDSEILTFLSGPAFQPWNRLGNIQGAWGGGEIPFSWIDQQFEMQLQIVSRMAELGMTPVLPAFSGYVPRAITRVLPNATVVTGSQWDQFPTQYTNDTFLEPSDPNFATIQKSFISKQQAAYGSNVTHIYTLDQYNENTPFSGDLDYLQNVTRNTWQSLKAADPGAIWMMQGWLFYANSAFWTDARIEAFLSGVETNSDMIILDLVSDAAPLWQATNSYYGKPWIWCQVHDYGGNMGFMGKILNVTHNATQALAESKSLIGFGNTMEGQEGNEVIYDLLLDQAWSSSPIDTETYFHNWVTARYGPENPPANVYAAWEILRMSVYNDTNPDSVAVPWPVVVYTPAIGIANITGVTALPYDPSLVVEAWSLLYNSARDEPSLWNNPSYQHDLVDVTRQVLENAFIPRYETLTDLYIGTNASTEEKFTSGKVLLDLLGALDTVLATNKNFLLSTWLTNARSWAGEDTTIADFFEYDARNIITLWGPNGEIKDYASKSWAGLVSSYYSPRWEIFVQYLVATPASAYNSTALNVKLLDFAQQWQNEKTSSNTTVSTKGKLNEVLEQVVKRWPDIFNSSSS
jgi:alpha-N-acetylglucosaminidase